MSYERFLRTHSLPNQTIEYTGEYYTLHNYDLDSYDRRFALIDRRIDNTVLYGNKEYYNELDRRVKLLHSQGFKFIMASPWESIENLKSGKIHPNDIGNVNSFNWTGGTSWFWWYMYDKHKDSKFNFDHSNKKYDFLYLNKQPREHRVKLYNALLDKGVLENSLHTNWPTRKLPAEYELPWAQNYPQYGRDQDIFSKPYNDTNCSLVSETNDNDYEVFMTEKIWKPIIAQHLFVVHGNHLYLQKLREIGFKTFSSYFDESYDLERDKDKRIEKIYKLCKDLLSKDWQDIYLQSKALRQHNYDTFFNKEKLSAEINKTLIGFLEFFDSSQVSS